MAAETRKRGTPELEPHCGSWFVVSRATGEPVLETFSRKIAERIDQAKYEVLTAATYLGSLNAHPTPKQDQQS